MMAAIAEAQPRIPSLRKPILMLTGCALGLIAALMALMGGMSPGWSLSLIFVFPTLVLLVAVMRKAALLAGRLDLFSPVVAFPLAYTLWFLAGSWSLWQGGGRIALYSGIGLLCYLLGVQLMRRKASWARPRPVECSDRWDRSAFFTVIIVLSMLAAGSYVAIVARMGIPVLSRDAGELRLQLVNYGPEMQVWLTSSYTVLLFLIVFLWRNEERRSFRLVCYAWIGVLSLALLSLGARGYLTIPIVTGLIARHYLRGAYKIVTLVAIGAILFVSLGLYGYTRDRLLSVGTLELADSDSIQGRLFPFIYLYVYVLQPVDALEQVTEVIPREVGYQHGSLTLGAFSTLLPGHHEMSDMFFKKILGNDFLGGGQPATLLGPFYGDFGLPGIAAGTFALGLLLMRLYSWMRVLPTPFRVLIYAWSMQTALFSLFGAIFPYITTLWLPVFWYALHTLVLQRSTPSQLQTSSQGHLPIRGT